MIEDDIAMFDWKVKHHPWGHDSLDRVSRTEPGNHKGRSSPVNTLLLVQSPVLLPKGEEIKLADFQGAYQANSHQSQEGRHEHKSAHVEPRGQSKSKHKL